jgi:hypothetical protein
MHIAECAASEAGISVKTCPISLSVAAGTMTSRASLPVELLWVLFNSFAYMSTTSAVRRTKEQDFGFSVRPP